MTLRKRYFQVASQASAAFLLLAILLAFGTGCKGPTEHRMEADEVVDDIVRQKQEQLFGRTSDFGIERPSDILRRRLLIEQDLPIAGEASLGTDELSPIEYWPADNYPDDDSSGRILPGSVAGPIKLSMIEALQIGARNSFRYQESKEDIFREALDLDLERNDFRDIFDGGTQSRIVSDLRGDRAESGIRNSGDISWSRQLESGAALTAGLAVDLVNLLTMGGASSMGLTGDASVSIPLLRGSGRHIVTENLTQAERNVVYSMYTFERFKKTFAVGVATDYLGVLNRLDSVKNSEENYRSLIASARRSRRLADAGSLTVLQVDQAVQSELRARNGWISAVKNYKERLDSFKVSLGLPPDAMIELEREDLDELVGATVSTMVGSADEGQLEDEPNIPPADAPIVLVEPGYEDAGPLEIDELLALGLGLDNRVDLRVTEGRVYDAQRKVVVAADRLGAELTLLGNADVGASRKVGSATSDDAKIRTDKGVYSGLLTLDLPFERTAERNLYRDSLIKLEESVRNVQQLEDQIKLAIRNELRDLQEARESIQIQAKSVKVAEKRVKSANMYLEAGRAEIRDLLEAQESLLSAQNGLTSSVINYRVAELQLQRDMGVLRIDEKGLWQEFDPKEVTNE